MEKGHLTFVQVRAQHHVQKECNLHVQKVHEEVHTLVLAARVAILVLLLQVLTVVLERIQTLLLVVVGRHIPVQALPRVVVQLIPVEVQLLHHVAMIVEVLVALLLRILLPAVVVLLHILRAAVLLVVVEEVILVVHLHHRVHQAVVVAEAVVEDNILLKRYSYEKYI